LRTPNQAGRVWVAAACKNRRLFGRNGCPDRWALTSVTAVVLGGASIFGGRGSFVGAFLGAILLRQIVTSTTFLSIPVAWNQYLLGILILVGARIYSRARGGATASEWARGVHSSEIFCTGNHAVNPMVLTHGWAERGG
jgi:hypothetical protein